jgi:hypothetical protein
LPIACNSMDSYRAGISVGIGVVWVEGWISVWQQVLTPTSLSLQLPSYCKFMF